jgi:hypothetical protein
MGFQTMNAAIPDLNITVSQKRWACVLDPTLALSRYGLPLVKQLGGVLELWVGRELWNILDNTHFYLEQPESLLLDRLTPISMTTQDRVRIQEIVGALREWERIRMETDLSDLKLFWIGDRLGESLLPPETDSEIVWRYESLAEPLAYSQEGCLPANEVLWSAFRDVVALAAARGSAFILTQLPEGVTTNSSPVICNALDAWGIPCKAIPAQDPWVALERDYLRRLLVQEGLAKLFWGGLRLVVLHLLIPSATNALSNSDIVSSEELFFAEDTDVDLAERQKRAINLWESAQAFWYSL